MGLKNIELIILRKVLKTIFPHKACIFIFVQDLHFLKEILALITWKILFYLKFSNF